MVTFLKNTLQSKDWSIITYFLVIFYLLIYGIYVIIPPVRTPDTVSVFLWTVGVHGMVGIALWSLLKNKHITIPLLFILFFVPRLIVFPMLPWLSDDVFGYLWYGHVTMQGMNPFLAPAESPIYESLRNGSYAMMAYKQFPAIYPPLAEVFMAAGVGLGELFSDGWYAALLGWKTILFLMETLMIVLMVKQKALRTHAFKQGIMLFIVCPLPVIEIMGQAHNDGLLLPFLIALYTLGSHALSRQSWQRSVGIGIIIGAMAAIKIYPIVMILPFLLHHTLSWKHKSVLSLSAGLTVLAVSLPFFWQNNALWQFTDVLQFYNRTSFNSPPLLFLRHVLESMNVHEWWNMAPKVLTAIRALSVIILAVIWYQYSKRHHTKDITEQCFSMTMAMLLCFLMLSPKVHTWYFVPVLGLNIITRFQSIGLIITAQMASYSIYLWQPPNEQFAIEWAAWACLFIAIAIEYRQIRQKNVVKIDQC